MEGVEVIRITGACKEFNDKNDLFLTNETAVYRYSKVSYKHSSGNFVEKLIFVCYSCFWYF